MGTAAGTTGLGCCFVQKEQRAVVAARVLDRMESSSSSPHAG